KTNISTGWGLYRCDPLLRTEGERTGRFSDSQTELIGVEFLSLPPLNYCRGKAQPFTKTV
ncbi:MAG: hypothetical protein AAF383_31425, partial [Cyanobacteria bacterium P01_A01_bin.83]